MEPTQRRFYLCVDASCDFKTSVRTEMDTHIESAHAQVTRLRSGPPSRGRHLSTALSNTQSDFQRESNLQQQDIQPTRRKQNYDGLSEQDTARKEDNDEAFDMQKGAVAMQKKKGNGSRTIFKTTRSQTVTKFTRCRTIAKTILSEKVDEDRSTLSLRETGEECPIRSYSSVVFTSFHTVPRNAPKRLASGLKSLKMSLCKTKSELRRLRHKVVSRKILLGASNATLDLTLAECEMYYKNFKENLKEIPVSTKELSDSKQEESLSKDQEVNSVQDQISNLIKEDMVNSAKDEDVNDKINDKELNSAINQKINSFKDQKVNSAKDLKVNSAKDRKVNSAKNKKSNSSKDQKVNSAKDQRVNSGKDQIVNSAKDQRVILAKDQKVNSAKDQKVKSSKYDEVNSVKDHKVNSANDDEVKSAKDQTVKSTNDEKVNSAKDNDVNSAKEQEVNSAGDQKVNLTNNQEQHSSENPTGNQKVNSTKDQKVNSTKDQKVISAKSQVFDSAEVHESNSASKQNFNSVKHQEVDLAFLEKEMGSGERPRLKDFPILKSLLESFRNTSQDKNEKGFGTQEKDELESTIASMKRKKTRIGSEKKKMKLKDMTLKSRSEVKEKLSVDVNQCDINGVQGSISRSKKSVCRKKESTYSKLKKRNKLRLAKNRAASEVKRLSTIMETEEQEGTHVEKKSNEIKKCPSEKISKTKKSSSKHECENHIEQTRVDKEKSLKTKSKFINDGKEKKEFNLSQYKVQTVDQQDSIYHALLSGKPIEQSILKSQGSSLSQKSFTKRSNDQKHSGTDVKRQKVNSGFKRTKSIDHKSKSRSASEIHENDLHKVQRRSVEQSSSDYRRDVQDSQQIQGCNTSNGRKPKEKSLSAKKDGKKSINRKRSDEHIYEYGSDPEQQLFVGHYVRVKSPSLAKKARQKNLEKIMAKISNEDQDRNVTKTQCTGSQLDNVATSHDEQNLSKANRTTDQIGQACHNPQKQDKVCPENSKTDECVPEDLGMQITADSESLRLNETLPSECGKGRENEETVNEQEIANLDQVNKTLPDLGSKMENNENPVKSKASSSEDEVPPKSITIISEDDVKSQNKRSSSEDVVKSKSKTSSSEDEVKSKSKTSSSEDEIKSKSKASSSEDKTKSKQSKKTSRKSSPRRLSPRRLSSRRSSPRRKQDNSSSVIELVQQTASLAIGEESSVEIPEVLEDAEEESGEKSKDKNIFGKKIDEDSIQKSEDSNENEDKGQLENTVRRDKDSTEEDVRKEEFSYEEVVNVGKTGEVNSKGEQLVQNERIEETSEEDPNTEVQKIFDGNKEEQTKDVRNTEKRTREEVSEETTISPLGTGNEQNGNEGINVREKLRSRTVGKTQKQKREDVRTNSANIIPDEEEAVAEINKRIVPKSSTVDLNSKEESNEEGKDDIDISENKISNTPIAKRRSEEGCDEKEVRSLTALDEEEAVAEINKRIVPKSSTVDLNSKEESNEEGKDDIDFSENKISNTPIAKRRSEEGCDEKEVRSLTALVQEQKSEDELNIKRKLRSRSARKTGKQQIKENAKNSAVDTDDAMHYEDKSKDEKKTEVEKRKVDQRITQEFSGKEKKVREERGREENVVKDSDENEKLNSAQGVNGEVIKLPIGSVQDQTNSLKRSKIKPKRRRRPVRKSVRQRSKGNAGSTIDAIMTNEDVNKEREKSKVDISALEQSKNQVAIVEKEKSTEESRLKDKNGMDNANEEESDSSAGKNGSNEDIGTPTTSLHEEQNHLHEEMETSQKLTRKCVQKTGNKRRKGKTVNSSSCGVTQDDKNEQQEKYQDDLSKVINQEERREEGKSREESSGGKKNDMGITIEEDTCKAVVEEKERLEQDKVGIEMESPQRELRTRHKRRSKSLSNGTRLSGKAPRQDDEVDSSVDCDTLMFNKYGDDVALNVKSREGASSVIGDVPLNPSEEKESLNGGTDSVDVKAKSIAPEKIVPPVTVKDISPILQKGPVSCVNEESIPKLTNCNVKPSRKRKHPQLYGYIKSKKFRKAKGSKQLMKNEKDLSEASGATNVQETEEEMIPLQPEIERAIHAELDDTETTGTVTGEKEIDDLSENQPQRKGIHDDASERLPQTTVNGEGSCANTNDETLELTTEGQFENVEDTSSSDQHDILDNGDNVSNVSESDIETRAEDVLHNEVKETEREENGCSDADAYTESKDHGSVNSDSKEVSSDFDETNMLNTNVPSECDKQAFEDKKKIDDHVDDSNEKIEIKTNSGKIKAKDDDIKDSELNSTTHFEVIDSSVDGSRNGCVTDDNITDVSSVCNDGAGGRQSFNQEDESNVDQCYDDTDSESVNEDRTSNKSLEDMKDDVSENKPLPAAVDNNITLEGIESEGYCEALDASTDMNRDGSMNIGGDSSIPGDIVDEESLNCAKEQVPCADDGNLPLINGTRNEENDSSTEGDVKNMIGTEEPRPSQADESSSSDQGEVNGKLGGREGLGESSEEDVRAFVYTQDMTDGDACEETNKLFEDAKTHDAPDQIETKSTQSESVFPPLMDDEVVSSEGDQHNAARVIKDNIGVNDNDGENLSEMTQNEDETKDESGEESADEVDVENVSDDAWEEDQSEVIPIAMRKEYIVKLLEEKKKKWDPLNMYSRGFDSRQENKSRENACIHNYAMEPVIHPPQLSSNSERAKCAIPENTQASATQSSMIMHAGRKSSLHPDFREQNISHVRALFKQTPKSTSAKTRKQKEGTLPPINFMLRARTCKEGRQKCWIAADTDAIHGFTPRPILGKNDGQVRDEELESGCSNNVLRESHVNCKETHYKQRRGSRGRNSRGSDGSTPLCLVQPKVRLGIEQCTAEFSRQSESFVQGYDGEGSETESFSLEKPSQFERTEEDDKGIEADKAEETSSNSEIESGFDTGSDLNLDNTLRSPSSHVLLSSDDRQLPVYNDNRSQSSCSESYQSLLSFNSPDKILSPDPNLPETEPDFTLSMDEQRESESQSEEGIHITNSQLDCDSLSEVGTDQQSDVGTEQSSISQGEKESQEERDTAVTDGQLNCDTISEFEVEQNSNESSTEVEHTNNNDDLDRQATIQNEEYGSCEMMCPPPKMTRSQVRSRFPTGFKEMQALMTNSSYIPGYNPYVQLYSVVPRGRSKDGVGKANGKDHAERTSRRGGKKGSELRKHTVHSTIQQEELAPNHTDITSNHTLIPETECMATDQNNCTRVLRKRKAQNAVEATGGEVQGDSRTNSTHDGQTNSAQSKHIAIQDGRDMEGRNIKISKKAIRTERKGKGKTSKAAVCDNRHDTATQDDPHSEDVLSLEPVSVTCEDFFKDVGALVWGKRSEDRWWPAIKIPGTLAGMTPAEPGTVWLFWCGDHKISKIPENRVQPFVSSYHSHVQGEKAGRNFTRGIDEALLICEQRCNIETESDMGMELRQWADKDFPLPPENWPAQASELVRPMKGYPLPDFVVKRLEEISLLVKRHSLEIESYDEKVEDVLLTEGKIRDDTCSAIALVFSGERLIEDICLACDNAEVEVECQHPLFVGGLCSNCKEVLMSTAFDIGDDGTGHFCAICSAGGKLFVCDSITCYRTYCNTCISTYLGDDAIRTVEETDPWMCFLCQPYCAKTHGPLYPKSNWKNNIRKLFQTNTQVVVPDIDYLRGPCVKRSQIRVLTLYDGICTGKLALEKLGLDVDVYYACEVAADCKLITQINQGNSVIQLGDVRDITQEKLESLGDIDLLLAGPPSQKLTVFGREQKSKDFEGEIFLFFEFFRILTMLDIMAQKSNRHVFWMYESEAAIVPHARKLISKYLKCSPALWDANFFSPINKVGLLWGNIPTIYSHPAYLTGSKSKVKLKDMLAANLNREARFEAVRTLPRTDHCEEGDESCLPVLMNGKEDNVWPVEIEKILGLPQHYTDVGYLCRRRKYEVLSEAWSVEMTKEALKSLTQYFKVKNV